MDQLRKNKVSLRGASTGEISRDDLLAKVSQERELRNYARRANAASLYIQRVWRSYIVRKKVALELLKEWESLMKHNKDSLIRSSIPSRVLRPFLFFIRSLSVHPHNIQARAIDCMQACFKILLESMNSNDPKHNFCLLSVKSIEERRTWACQARKLVSLCAFLLTECNKSHERVKDVIVITTLSLRILIVLTDPKSWKGITKKNMKEAETASETIIRYLGARESGYYTSLRSYFLTLHKQTDDRLLITASALTLALRPFHIRESDFVDGDDRSDMNLAVQEYFCSVLTIPQLTRCLPSALICALKHKTVLMPCFHTLLTSWDKVLVRVSDLEQSEKQSSSTSIHYIGWGLGNIVSLVTGNEKDFVDPHGSYPQMFYASYVHAVIALAENFISRLGKVEDHDNHHENGIEIVYLELLRPICHQWHLAKLLAALRKESYSDIARFYSYMLRIFSALNPVAGPLPVLNMLSFSPGYLVSLWATLESLLLPRDGQTSNNPAKASWNKASVSDRKGKNVKIDGVNKLVNVLNRFSGKSQNPISVHQMESSQTIEETTDSVWDVESLRAGPLGISDDILCLLHLFCAAYSHLLFVLDDIEFYDKQVPFAIEKQRRIAAVLNTLVYNGLLHGTRTENRQAMESGIRCLHLLYERDCRRSFCPPALWLAPGRTSRPPIAVAARTHEIASANDVLTTGSVITITPHVFPFEERVHVFREFITMDKAARKMAGEINAPGSRSIEIVIRRSHVVEDGFRQLNSIGSRLKSSIHISFVNESGLPEAGLDYGGLSKEFLTDITKTAFAPEYGLFSQSPTSERLLVPSTSARYLENGIQMIEFLGRIVGKALYEGILLDYSFSHVFIHKLLGRYSFLDELSGLDPELYKNLMYIKHYDGDVADLCLDFTVTEEYCGKRSIIEIKPGGKDMAVTNENKMQYIHAMADYKLNCQIMLFSNAFYRGLIDLISPSWLKLFNAHEFNQLLSGGNHDIDVDDLRNNTKYTGGYSDSSRTIKIFWEVMKEFEPKERCMLLKFVTSCSRAPLLGFKFLLPTFTIHKVVCETSIWAAIGGQDVDRLPSASTCYNILKLPVYKRASTMREKLLYAITSNAGFELS